MKAGWLSVRCACASNASRLMPRRKTRIASGDSSMIRSTAVSPRLVPRSAAISPIDIPMYRPVRVSEKYSRPPMAWVTAICSSMIARDLAAVGRVVAQALDGRVEAAELVLGREPHEQVARSGRVEVPVDAEVDAGLAGLFEQRLGLVVDRLVRLAGSGRPRDGRSRSTHGRRPVLPMAL